MPTLAVPDRFVPPFVKLRAMHKEEYSTLREGLTQARPTLNSSALARVVATESGLGSSDVEALIDALTELLAAGRAQDLSERESALEVAGDPQLQDEKNDVSGLVSRITELLHCLPIRLPSEHLRSRFTNLVQLWMEETILSSSTHEICSHWAYQRIIGLGSAVVPLIIEEVQKGGRHWGWALSAITGENPAKHADSLKAASEAWIAWNQQRCLDVR